MIIRLKFCWRTRRTSSPSKLEQWFKDRFGDGLVESALYFLSILIGVGLAVGLFILLPALVTGFLPDSTAHWGRNLLEGVLRIFIFIAYMALMSMIPDMKRTFRYHGAEHKTIYCYEKQLELTVENVRVQPREHPRCRHELFVRDYDYQHFGVLRRHGGEQNHAACAAPCAAADCHRSEL